MKAELVLALPGRLRIKVDKIYENGRLAREISYYLLGFSGIRYAEANRYTGKILICFDSERLQDIEVIRLIEGFTSNQKFTALDRKTQISMRDLPWKAILSGLGFGILALKHGTIGTSSLTENEPILNMAAITTAVTGYPIYRRGIDRLFEKRQISSELVLTGASFLFFFLRESTAGLLVTFLLSLITGGHLDKMKDIQQQIKQMALGDDRFKVYRADGSFMEIPVHELNHGDIVGIEEKNIVPKDGIIVQGRGIFGQSRLNGQLKPVVKTAGDHVPAGAMLMKGQVQLSIDTLSTENNKDGLRRLLDGHADNYPVPPQDRIWSQKVTWMSIVFSGIVYLMTGDVTRSLAMLLVACPSGIEKSYPLAAAHAVLFGSHRGIIIKNEQAFLEAAAAHTAVLDKTGTVSLGYPEVTRIHALKEAYGERDILGIAAQGEIGARHPFGAAIEEQALKESIPLHVDEPLKVEEGEGGIRYWQQDKTYYIGNRKWMHQHNIVMEPLPVDLNNRESRQDSNIFVAVNQELIGVIQLRDVLKPEAVAMIRHLKDDGLKRLHMASGDEDAVTRYAARQLGIKYSYGGLNPHDKLRLVNKLKKKDKVLMIGDALNDLKALSAADCGIVLAGRRSEASLYSGDAILLGDDLTRVEDCLRLSRHTGGIARQNELIALAGNLIGFVMTAAGLLSPFDASLYHNANILVIIANAYRLSHLVKGNSSGKGTIPDWKPDYLISALLEKGWIWDGGKRKTGG